MKYLSEKTVPGHVQRRQLEKVVNAVLQHHAVFTRTLGRVHNLPYLFQRHGCRNFTSNVLALFHRIKHHLGMVLPVRHDVYQVDVVPLAQFLPCICAPTVGGRQRKTRLIQYLLGPFDPIGMFVAQGNDLYARNVGETFHSTRTTHAQPDEAHTNRVQLRRSQTQNMRLTRRTLGYFRPNK